MERRGPGAEASEIFLRQLEREAMGEEGLGQGEGGATAATGGGGEGTGLRRRSLGELMLLRSNLQKARALQANDQEGKSFQVQGDGCC